MILIFSNQSICCGYSKEQSQLDGTFEPPKYMLKLIDENILTFYTHFFCWIDLWLNIYMVICIFRTSYRKKKEQQGLT